MATGVSGAWLADVGLSGELIFLGVPRLHWSDLDTAFSCTVDGVDAAACRLAQRR